MTVNQKLPSLKPDDYGKSRNGKFEEFFELPAGSTDIKTRNFQAVSLESAKKFYQVDMDGVIDFEHEKNDEFTNTHNLVVKKSEKGVVSLVIEASTINPAVAVENQKKKELTAIQLKKQVEIALRNAPLEWLDGPDGEIEVPLTSMRRLDDPMINMPYHEVAIRPIDKDNVDNLYYSLRRGDTLPAWKVLRFGKTATVEDGKYHVEVNGVYGGYHRWLATERYIHRLVTNQLFTEESEIRKPAAYTDAEKAEINKRIKEYKVKVVYGNSLKDGWAVANAANDDNGKHGLANQKKTKTLWAWTMWKHSHEPGQVKLSKVEVATIVGCTPQLISNFDTMQKKKAAEKAEQEKLAKDIADLSDDDKAAYLAQRKELQESQDDGQDAKLDSACKKLINASNDIAKVFADSQSLYYYLKPYIKPENTDALKLIAEALKALASEVSNG